MSTSPGTLLKQRLLSSEEDKIKFSELEQELYKLNKIKPPKIESQLSFFNLCDFSSYIIPNFVTKLIWFITTHITFFSVLGFAIFWCSILIYITFYYNFIPTLTHKKKINFEFDSKCDHLCRNPSVNINLRDIYAPKLFSTGQSYKFLVNLNLPESDINWRQGIFMIRMHLLDSKGNIITSGFKSAILKFKSLPIRLINVIAFWPFYVFNLMEESQTISVEIISNYIDNLNYQGEAFKAMITIEARNIQIYDSELLITATLSGLRYYMLCWPVTSAFVGISIIFFFLSLLSIISFYKLIFNISDSTEQLTEELLKDSYKDQDCCFYSPDTTNNFNDLD